MLSTQAFTQSSQLQAQGDVDRLPSNARLIRMPAICFWGMLGTLFESGALSQDLLRSFTYITVASSFMRGPFLPVALQVKPALKSLCGPWKVLTGLETTHRSFLFHAGPLPACGSAGEAMPGLE